jgi:AcrR family transcriptional regulator
VSRRDEILDAAERLLEAEGPPALSMRRIATELGMQAPSLYKHLPSKDAIVAGLQERALVGMADALSGTGTDVCRMASAYRRWALANPQLYLLTTRGTLHRDQLPEGVEDAAAAPVVAAAAGDAATARALWGLVHGLVDLELTGRFPPDADVDAAWEAAVAMASASSATSGAQDPSGSTTSPSG